MKSGSSRALPFRMIAVALIPTFAILLSACQSGGSISDTLDPAAIDASGHAAPGPVQKAQSIGKGSTKISMLLPLSAGGSAGEEGRKMRDAAQLAMADLGNDFLTLTIEDTRGDSTRAKDLAIGAMSSGAKVVIGPAELPAARQLASLSGTRKPIVLALADNFPGGPGVYSVRLNEADSAAAGAAAIAAKGSRKFVLFVAAGANAGAIEKRVANSLSIYGATLSVTMPYSLSGSEKAVSDMAALVDSPEAIVVASGDADPSAIVSGLKAKGLLGKGVSLVGTHRWLEHPVDDPLLQGAYVAALDNAEIGPIASRFENTFNYSPDVNAAYAYDMVALTAGIASALGSDGFKREILENSSGFRGSTGIFRFRTDGASERSMPFYRIEKGTLKQVAKSTSSF